METRKLGLSKDLVAELASALHYRAKHLVIGTASEEDLPSVKLEEGAAN